MKELYNPLLRFAVVLNGYDTIRAALVDRSTSIATAGRPGPGSHYMQYSNPNALGTVCSIALVQSLEESIVITGVSYQFA